MEVIKLKDKDKIAPIKGLVNIIIWVVIFFLVSILFSKNLKD
jgi:hypothetical protein